MKRHILGVMAFLFAVSAVGCAGDPQNDTTEITQSQSDDAAVTDEMTSADEETQDEISDGDRYYNVIEEGGEFNAVKQMSGTCWIYAATASMEANYALKYGSPVKLSRPKILDCVYFKYTDTPETEGYYIQKNIDRYNLGGQPWLVVYQVSNGCEDFVLDDAAFVNYKDVDNVKQAIKKYGAASISICDTSESIKEMHNGYRTMNNPKSTIFDHEITIIGWDDDFPKEWFAVEPKENGAWITYDSAVPTEKYYISYETPINEHPLIFMSVSFDYSEVLSHDCCHGNYICVKNGEPVKTANVFHQKGTLAAVGTYNDIEEQDIKIEIYDSELKNVLYTREAKLDHQGYLTVKLDEPVEVDDFAVAVTYSSYAPVEGVPQRMVGVKQVIRSDEGQSFVYLPETDEWKDMHDEDIRECITSDFLPNNCCIKALMK